MITSSFIHYGDLYSAPSRLLLRSAPDPCTAKEKSFEARVKCVRKNPGEQSLRQRKPIPHRGANHRECKQQGPSISREQESAGHLGAGACVNEVIKCNCYFRKALFSSIQLLFKAALFSSRENLPTFALIQSLCPLRKDYFHQNNIHLEIIHCILSKGESSFHFS